MINMNIRPLKEYTREAFLELNKIQTGEKLLPKTGFEFIDGHLGCLLPSDVCLISSPSGTGKTTIAQKIKKNLLNVELNPSAENYIFVDFSLEMKVFNLIMRGSSEILNKKKSEVLFNEFTEEEKVLINDYYKNLNDNRQFLCQVPPTPEQFFKDCDEFLEKYKEKEAVFINIDHVLLLSGSDKTRLLESLCEQINQLKLKHQNAYFLLISQNNRAIYDRIGERNNRSAPNPTDVFGSSFLDQLCSFNIVLFNPFKAGIKEYMKVNPSRYEHLNKYFTEEDSKGRVSFITDGLIFAHCIKTRESDNPYKDIFVIDTGVRAEETKKEEVLQVPIFERSAPVEPNFDMNVAFGEPVSSSEDLDEDMPF